jgi:hypothetical protein
LLNENQAELTVFPNPSRDKLHIRFTQPQQSKAQLYVMNAMGQIVYNAPIQSEYTSQGNMGGTNAIFNYTYLWKPIFKR